MDKERLDRDIENLLAEKCPPDADPILDALAKARSWDTQANTTGACIGGIAGQAETATGARIREQKRNRHHRYTLANRIEERLACAQKEASQANELQRLAWLLQKNPEIAEMLDLLEKYGR